MPIGIGEYQQENLVSSPSEDTPMPINFFDVSYYRSANSDLTGLTDAQALSHFQKFGLDEGRVFSPYADLSFYRAGSSDLTGLTNRQLYEHLSNYGVAEGRKFSAIVDLGFYRSANSDLTSLNNEQLFEHLRTYGVAEGRAFSTVFDANYYLALNSDLNTVYGGNRSQGLTHFTIYGLQEGRMSAIAFDVNSYRSYNSDLNGFSNSQLLDHFQRYGINEGRVTTDRFNVAYYLSNNSDLQVAGYGYRQAYEHFLQYGIREGRNASSLITSDVAGNSLNVARNLAIGSKAVTVRDGIGGTDTLDVYQFTINSDNTSLLLELNGLSGNADLQLLGSDGNVLASSVNAGNDNEVINLNRLNRGNYYIRVYPGNTEMVTNYNLTFTASLVSDTTLWSNSQTNTAISPTSSSSLSPFIQRVLELTNAERAKAGLSPLKINDKLNKSAQEHSQEMGDKDYFSHKGYNGSSIGDRVYASGYQYRFAGENIAAGQTTPEEVVQAWMNSQGHRENILNPQYQEIGIGYYYLANDMGEVNYNHYWTQNFGTA